VGFFFGMRGQEGAKVSREGDRVGSMAFFFPFSFSFSLSRSFRCFCLVERRIRQRSFVARHYIGDGVDSESSPSERNAFEYSTSRVQHSLS